MNNLSENTEPAIQKFKRTIERKYGTVFAEGPDGTQYEAQTLRDMQALTGVRYNTIDYAIKHSGKAKGGWKFWRTWN